ncbi:SAM-dependent methyltransferase [Frankia sp. KB5]|uniref:THUMP-like domain-containing protein n=1 Tax=Frankia sp. KB5 TaxID=683318 RepID=UPI000A11CF89|nr:SAM-dependent methyltransferase [Frankia sp. KB5]ORT48505.1 SAM-dependent methyltransferase [Frankia sp. KB5]
MTASDGDRLAQFEALLSAQGKAVLAAAVAAFAEDERAGGGAARELAVGARLRAEGVSPALLAAAFTQAELRRRAMVKFARADRMFFTRAGLEQASSQAAAEHRAARFAGLCRLVDLCTGIGGDALALARGREIMLVDRDPVHLRMAALNVAVHAVEGTTVLPTTVLPTTVLPTTAPPTGSTVPTGCLETRLSDVREVDLSGCDAVFVDPARRAGDRRLVSRASEPPLAWCFGLADKVAAVAVKAAPGLATELVPPGWEIEFVADGRDLKEAVLFSPALATASRRATVLPGPGGSASLRARGAPVSLTGTPDPVVPADTGRAGRVGRVGRVGELAGRVAAPGRFLHDPSPAVTRAGLIGELGRRLGAWQIDPMIAFLTSDEAVTTPFARLLCIEAELPFDVRRIADLLRSREIGSLDVRRRGLAGDVEEIRRRLLPRRRDLIPGGPAVTVVMTRLRGAPWAFVCTPVSDVGGIGCRGGGDRLS